MAHDHERNSDAQRVGNQGEFVSAARRIGRL
jgi:hypothetical protein